MAETEVLSPAAPDPHILVTFNAPSLVRFGPRVVRGGVIIYDSSVTPDAPSFPDVLMVPIPATTIAAEIGRPLVKNIVMVGALAEATALLPNESFLSAIRASLRDKPDLMALNEEAFARGALAVRAHEVTADQDRCCPESQADGVPCQCVDGTCAECARSLVRS